MMAQLARTALVGTLFLLGGASVGFADCLPDEWETEEEKLSCSDFISSGEADEPKSGYLIGSSDVTVTTGSNTGTSATVGGGVIPAGIGASTSSTGSMSETYEVGYYKMSDGSIARIDCRTYTLAS